MRKFLTGLIVGLVIALAVPAVAAVNGQFQGYDIVKVLVNGEEVASEVPAVMLGDRTMVPLRFVSEALGADVKWDDATWTAKVETSPANKTRIKTLDEFGQRRDTLVSGLRYLREEIRDQISNPSIVDDWSVIGEGTGYMLNWYNSSIDDGIIEDVSYEIGQLGRASLLEIAAAILAQEYPNKVLSSASKKETLQAATILLDVSREIEKSALGITD